GVDAHVDQEGNAVSPEQDRRDRDHEPHERQRAVHLPIEVLVAEQAMEMDDDPQGIRRPGRQMDTRAAECLHLVMTPNSDPRTRCGRGPGETPCMERSQTGYTHTARMEAGVEKGGSTCAIEPFAWSVSKHRPGHPALNGSDGARCSPASSSDSRCCCWCRRWGPRWRSLR